MWGYHDDDSNDKTKAAAKSTDDVYQGPRSSLRDLSGRMCVCMCVGGIRKGETPGEMIPNEITKEKITKEKARKEKVEMGRTIPKR